MDINYQRFGIVDENLKITKLGTMYCLKLIGSIYDRNMNVGVSTDCYIYIEPTQIPSFAAMTNPKFGIDDDDMFSQRGKRWLSRYLHTHDFNPYVYSLVKDIYGLEVCVPA